MIPLFNIGTNKGCNVKKIIIIIIKCDVQRL